MTRCVHRPPTHLSISCSALSDVLVCWALRTVALVFGAGDFKRSTWLLILLPRRASQAWEKCSERKKASCKGEGQSGGLGPLVFRSVLDTAYGTGLEDTSCPHCKPLPAPPANWASLWGMLHFAQPYWLFGREGKVWLDGESVRGKEGEMGKSRELSKAVTSPWLHL